MAESFCDGKHVGLVLTMDEAVFLRLLLGQVEGMEREYSSGIYSVLKSHTNPLLNTVVTHKGDYNAIGEYVIPIAPRLSGNHWSDFPKGGE